MNARVKMYPIGSTCSASTDKYNKIYKIIPEEITKTNKYAPTSRKDGHSLDMIRYIFLVCFMFFHSTANRRY